jgi:stage II sporulation protein D
MRRLLLLLVLALAAPSSASAGSAFFVDGRGWGHGIGMAQWGAYGYALKGNRTYDWILEHYYPGTTLAQTSVRTVRVQLVAGRKSVRLGSAAPFTLRDVNDRTIVFPDGTVTLTPALKANGKQLEGPVTVTRGSRNLSLNGRLYRGKLLIHVRGGRLTVVNQVGIDDYVAGVVPDEMPTSWSMEALKTQAVAARSYAVATRKTGGIFDLYSDTRSQVYGGVSAEDVRATDAVEATGRQVLKYDGEVAVAYFSSTSGGRTAAIQDVWGSDPVPYLVSVPDKYDYLSPHHRWGTLRYTARALKRALGGAAPKGRLLDATVVRNPSSRVDTVTFRGTRTTSSVSGTELRGILGLRSSWFSIAILRLTGPGKSKPGQRQVLDGLVRGITDVWLERRVAGGGWERMRDLAPDADGLLRVRVRPRATTSYRLGAAKGYGVSVRVAVTR